MLSRESGFYFACNVDARLNCGSSLENALFRYWMHCVQYRFGFHCVPN